MKRREFITLFGGTALTWPLMASAQQPQVRTVGFLYPGPAIAATSRVAAVVEGLRAGGYREPQDVKVITRSAEGDVRLLPSMAADLIARKVDLIVAVSPEAVRAAQSATATIPIIVGDLESDPVAVGFVHSIAKPGGNITGVFLDFPEFGKKWVELLKESVPQLASVAVFWDPATGMMQLNAVESAAKTFNLKLDRLELRGRADVESVFVAATQRGAGALLMLSSPFVGANTKLLADLAAAHRLPAITLFTDFARNGGLMAYGPNLLAYFRQEGVMAAKILHGEKAANLPVETPTKFELVINLKTAKAIGVTIPPTLIAVADDVIE